MLQEKAAKAFVEALIEGARQERPAIDIEAQKLDLENWLKDIQAPCPFKVGDFVQQRKEASLYQQPHILEVAVVLEVLETPFEVDSRDIPNGSRPDMRIITKLGDKQVPVVLLVESWRFESLKD